jgi:hypothetical protein
MDRDISLYKREKLEFVKLVEQLLPQTIDLEGCEVKFPETAFFGEDGKPALMAKTDKDGRMTSVTQTTKLSIATIK